MDNEIICSILVFQNMLTYMWIHAHRNIVLEIELLDKAVYVFVGFIFLLKCDRHTPLCWFQVHSVVICVYWGRISTVSLVNILHHSSKMFLLQWELLRCTLSNFQVCSRILLTIVTVLTLAPWPAYFITGNVRFLAPFIRFVLVMVSL